MSLFDISERAQQFQKELLDFVESDCVPGRGGLRGADAGIRRPALPAADHRGAQGRGPQARRCGTCSTRTRHRAPGLTNLEYAPLAEIIGRSHHRPRGAATARAPDTGNMEVLDLFGTDEQKEQWLEPLLDGEIRSAFAMTEPRRGQLRRDQHRAVASMRDGDDYVINGRKWWTSNALHPNCKVLIVMGKTDPDAAAAPAAVDDAGARSTRPGVTIVRGLPVFGYHGPRGPRRGRLRQTCACPPTNLLAGEGERLRDRPGPARPRPHPPLHAGDRHGRARPGADVRRAQSRVTFGKPLADKRQHPGLDRRAAHRDRAWPGCSRSRPPG